MTDTPHRHICYVDDTEQVKFAWEEGATVREDGRTLTAQDCEAPECPSRVGPSKRHAERKRTPVPVRLNVNLGTGERKQQRRDAYPGWQRDWPLHPHEGSEEALTRAQAKRQRRRERNLNQ